MTRAGAIGGLTAAIWVLGLTVASAQFGFGRGESGMPAVYAPDVFPDRNFAVCRLEYTRVRVEASGGGWRTDYPYGEINLSIRLSELTRTAVSWHAGREPRHYVVRLMHDALFECPFLIASDVGTAGFRQEEADRLRTYLLKGGFLWADDFWGDAAWEHWTAQLRKALPAPEFTIEDIPPSDPIFRSQFVVTEVPQITNIRYWRFSRGQQTSERGAETERVNFRGIRDRAGRLMVVMTHNSDVADSWEREGEDPGFFYQFSPAGYAFGINVLLHAMTH